MVVAEGESSADEDEGKTSPAQLRMYVSWADLDGYQIVVAYSCIGGRSAAWCQEAADATEKPEVYNLYGGVAAWTHHGGKLVHPVSGTPSRQVHCCQASLASFFPSRGYEVVCPPLAASLCTSRSCALVDVSVARRARLNRFAWEISLRHCPSIVCLEAEDILRMIWSRKDHVVFIDCRSDDERQVSMIAPTGSPVLTKQQIQNSLPEFSLKPWTFVAYCAVGGRSGLFPGGWAWDRGGG